MLNFGEPQEALSDLLKEGQRKSSSWKRCWQIYCMNYGGGTNDPSKQGDAFCEEFMDFVARCGEHVVGGGPMPGQPKRKMSDGGGETDWMAAAASGDWDQLVAAVKAFQRIGPGNKDMWATYCDKAYAGTRDPSRHDVTSLQTFLMSYAAGGGCAWGGMEGPPMKRMNLGGGMSAATSGGGKDWLIGQVKAFQRQGPQYQEMWAQFCDGQCGGTRDPNRHEAASLEAFLVEQGLMEGSGSSGGEWQKQQMQMMNPSYVSGWGVPNGPSPSGKSKTQLVMHVKAFQRLSPENKEIWGTYCDTAYGGTRDPNNHDATSLETFIKEYTSGSMIELGDGKQIMSTGDAVKDELIAKVKAYQRSGEQPKETWASYAEAQLGGFRDPARHDVAILQHFVNVYGL